jgi:ATP-dependent helicase/nuclease subunit B
LRHQALARWPATAYWQAWQQPAVTLALQTEDWRQRLQAPRSLAQWLADVRTVLQATGQWYWLQDDPAGQALMQSLHWQSDTNPLTPHATHWTLADFRNWVAQTLEAGHFNPPHPPCEQVAIVPLAQLLARPFTAVVLPGCNEKRLPASPDLPGLWTTAQRTLLGLPGRAQVQQAQRSAWQHLLQTPQLDLLLSHHENNAAVLPSPLLLEWQLSASSAGLRAISPAADPRDWRHVPAQPPARPQPQGQRLRRPARLPLPFFRPLPIAPARNARADRRRGKARLRHLAASHAVPVP